MGDRWSRQEEKCDKHKKEVIGGDRWWGNEVKGLMVRNESSHLKKIK